NDFVLGRTVVPYVLTHGLFVGPEAPGQILVDQDHGFPLRVFISGEGSAFQDRNSHRSEIVGTDNRPIDIDQFAASQPSVAFGSDVGRPVLKTRQAGREGRGFNSGLSLDAIEYLLEQVRLLALTA